MTNPTRSDQGVPKVVLVDRDGNILSAAQLGGSPDTELPAAAALADNTATPTVPATGAFVMVYDGATWDFLRGDASLGALVNTELAAAAALADGFANPTTSQVAALLKGFNGTTWDRLRTRGTGILQVEPAYSFLNVAAGQATTVVKDGAGTLHSITFHGLPTATSTFTVYDNNAASGTKIATILAAGVNAVPATLIFDLAFGTGLTIITATANWADFTVTYR